MRRIHLTDLAPSPTYQLAQEACVLQPELAQAGHDICRRTLVLR